MSTRNTYIIIKNIPNYVDSNFAENGIRLILNRQNNRFGSPSDIKINQSPFVASKFAIVLYSNSSFNEEIVKYFDNTLAFGAVLSFKLANRNFSLTTRGFSIDSSHIGQTGNNTNADYFNIFSNELISTSNNDVGSNIIQTNNNNAANVDVNVVHKTSSISHVSLAKEIVAIFKCSRCEFNFQQNQDKFEVHVDQCKINEELSISSCLRKGICKICNTMFLQTPVKSMFILSCGHLFHKECFAKIKEKSKQCIICHENIQENLKGCFFL